MNDNLPFIRFNHLWKEKKVVTNIFWESIVLKNDEFYKYLENTLDIDSEIYKNLEIKKFIKNNEQEYIDNSIIEYKKRFWINFIWPTLHIIVLTKWCNHQCKYCHAAADYRYTDDWLSMNKQTAQKVVDIILSSPSNNLTIEFQWWEPLVNMEIIDFIINYTQEKNKLLKKNISYALVSNLTLIDEKILETLFSYPNLSISTSLDWDKKTHDFNRLMIWKKDSVSSFDVLKEKISLIREWENKKWKKILYWAMWVITRKTLSRYKELVDTYIELWFDNIFLKKLNWLWFAVKTKNTLWYSKEELVEFYKNYFWYLVELYNKWVKINEWFLKIILSKILKPQDMNFMDLRSPCWAWIWQIAYDYTGSIYTCDEWRMVEDDTFKIWDVDSSLEDLIQNEVVWAMMDASIVESLPCDICAYAPFCWVCPIESYQARWNIYTNQVFDNHCNFFMFLFDWVFEKLSNKDSLEYDFVRSQVK